MSPIAKIPTTSTLTHLFESFYKSEKSGGVILVICSVTSIIATNSFLHDPYTAIWHFEIGGHSVIHWINDGLMTIFFLMIGLELEREIYIGELSDVRNALLPVFAAVGGMVVPAGIHLAFNYGTASQDGAGIPMATDIAFALGVLSLLGKKIPIALKVFLTALAVIDDLGAIIVIAIFYTGTIHWMNLAIAMSIFGFLLILNRLKVHHTIVYLIAGVFMWYFMLHSGVHATITGVLLAFALPFGDGSEKSPSYNLEKQLHSLVAFIVLPVFALANSSLAIDSHWYQVVLTTNGLGISLGLLAGKPIGIISFTYLAIKSKLTSLPPGIGFRHVTGAAFLGGIGFTMSIFIALLAFQETAIIDQSKMAVMITSVISGLIGYLILYYTPKQVASNR